MTRHDLSSEDSAFVTLLKVCGRRKDLHRGTTIHSDIVKRGLLETSSYVAFALVGMYAKSGSLVRAEEIVIGLPFRDPLPWNILVAEYALQGQGEQALICFERMQYEGFIPNAATFTCIFKACGTIGAVDMGEHIHDEVCKEGLLKTNIVLGTALVNMYVNCRALEKARQVLDDLPARDVVSWSTLIAGYAQQGQGEEALSCFERMKSEGISPDVAAFTCVLGACGNIGAADKGEEVHDEIVRLGLLGEDVAIGTVLVSMYAKCGALAKAQRVLEELPVRDVVAWSALIAGHVQQGHGEKALSCFETMQGEGILPNAVTYTCLFKACGLIRALGLGERIHEEIHRQGLVKKDSVLGTALVQMYVQCGALTRARQVLEDLPLRNEVSWSVLIAGYAEQGQGEEVLNCYDLMQEEGLLPNVATFRYVLKACGITGAIDTGAEVLHEIVKHGCLQSNAVLGTAVLAMYVKCGAMARAQDVMEQYLVGSVASWNVLIAGYVEQGWCRDALDLIEYMELKGFSPDVVTFTCILKVCGSIGTAEKGEEIHTEISRQGLLEKDVLLATSLVDMYAKCSALARARQVLEELPVDNIATWNALIAGYAQHGLGPEALACYDKMLSRGLCPDEITISSICKACRSVGADKWKHMIASQVSGPGMEALVLHSAGNIVFWHALMAGCAKHGEGHEAMNSFREMQQMGISPDTVTFTLLLNACSHTGLVEEGQNYFAAMSTGYGIIPGIKHYACMVDLLGRAGHFEKVVAFTQDIPFSDSFVILSALLGACYIWGKVNVGRWAFEHAIQVSASAATPFVCMANIYTASMQEE